jgi:hypothetical protein
MVLRSNSDVCNNTDFRYNPLPCSKVRNFKSTDLCGCDAVVWSGRSLLMFRKNVLPPSSGSNLCFFISYSLGLLFDRNVGKFRLHTLLHRHRRDSPILTSNHDVTASVCNTSCENCLGHKNSGALVRMRTIPTERPTLADGGCRVVSAKNPHGR